jgi:hypothetical protein
VIWNLLHAIWNLILSIFETRITLLNPKEYPMKTLSFISIVTLLAMMSCKTPAPKAEPKTDNFQYLIEQFADLKIMRYPVIGFDDLTLKEKELVYYLSSCC